jgi:hypothetical protein
VEYKEGNIRAISNYGQQAIFYKVKYGIVWPIPYGRKQG